MYILHKGAQYRLGIGLLSSLVLSGCGIFHPSSQSSASGAATSGPGADASLVQSLQRQVREQNKRISELQSQLDALKVIEQDMGEWRKGVRQPTTVAPSATDRPR